MLAYRSQPLGPYNGSSGVPVISCSGSYLERSNITPANGVVGYVGAGMQSNGAVPGGGNWTWIFSRANGAGDVAFDGHATVVQSFTYKFPGR